MQTQKIIKEETIKMADLSDKERVKKAQETHKSFLKEMEKARKDFEKKNTPTGSVHFFFYTGEDSKTETLGCIGSSAHERALAVKSLLKDPLCKKAYDRLCSEDEIDSEFGALIEKLEKLKEMLDK